MVRFFTTGTALKGRNLSLKEAILKGKNFFPLKVVQTLEAILGEIFLFYPDVRKHNFFLATPLNKVYGFSGGT